MTVKELSDKLKKTKAKKITISNDKRDYDIEFFLIWNGYHFELESLPFGFRYEITNKYYKN